MPGTTIHIAIPVRNEEARIEHALDALARQEDHWGKPIPPDSYMVHVLVNNSDDSSASSARRFGEKHPGFRLAVREVTLEKENSHIGWARRLAMHEAARLAYANSPRSIVATTDADSRVCSQWLARLTEEFARGADAVCGRILLDESESLACDPITMRRHREDERYRLLAARFEDTLDPLSHDPWPRHYQHFGANFAVRADKFLQAGGVPPKNGLEDVALFESLLACDARVRHAFSPAVRTSARREGRSAIGLSAQLRDWSSEQNAHSVECAEFLSTLFRTRATLRSFWALPRSVCDFRKVEGATGIPAEILRREMAQRNYFGEALRALCLRDRLMEQWPGPVWGSPKMEANLLEQVLPSRGAFIDAGGDRAETSRTAPRERAETRGA